MAAYLEYFDIDIFVNGILFDMVPSGYSFSIKDSIYSFYSIATFDVPDITGVILENLHLSKGSHFKIKYGNNDSVDESEFIILQRSLPETIRHGILSGTVSLKLVHQLYDIQEKKSAAYSNTISNIIQQLFASSFSSLDLSSTVGTDIWYQPLMSDVQFCTDVLLPNAYSSNANNTPFYLYTTVDNVLHLKTGYELYTQSITTTLRYTPIASRNSQKSEVFNKNSILSLALMEIDDKKDIIRPLQNRTIGQIDQLTGELKEITKDSFIDYAPFSQSYPLLVGSSDYLTDYIDMGFYGETALRQQHKLAQIHSSQRYGMMPIKLFALTPLNPSLYAGKKINLEVYTPKGEGVSELSSIFSGNYVIESCEKIWNGPKNMGYNAMVLGRKMFSVPNNYTMKSRLFTK